MYYRRNQIYKNLRARTHFVKISFHFPVDFVLTVNHNFVNDL